jgi:hypothetical protein
VAVMAGTNGGEKGPTGADVESDPSLLTRTPGIASDSDRIVPDDSDQAG